MWTRFMDMHSGGSCKEPQQYIYIEAPEAEAKVIFYNRFGHNPERVTCTCCGEDYSVDVAESLEQLTGYDRSCDGGYVLQDGSVINEEEWYHLPLEERRLAKYKYLERPATKNRLFTKGYQTLEQYESRQDVLIIRTDQIKPEERIGAVPTQGYVWAG
jgi:hypothetical protein